MILKKSNMETVEFADKYNAIQAASSDAHGVNGIGYTYTEVNDFSSAKSFRNALKNSKLIYSRPPLKSFLAPIVNRIKNI